MLGDAGVGHRADHGGSLYGRRARQGARELRAGGAGAAAGGRRPGRPAPRRPASPAPAGPWLAGTPHAHPLWATSSSSTTCTTSAWSSWTRPVPAAPYPRRFPARIPRDAGQRPRRPGQADLHPGRLRRLLHQAGGGPAEADRGRRPHAPGDHAVGQNLTTQVLKLAENPNDKRAEGGTASATPAARPSTGACSSPTRASARARSVAARAATTARHRRRTRLPPAVRRRSVSAGAAARIGSAPPHPAQLRVPAVCPRRSGRHSSSRSAPRCGCRDTRPAPASGRAWAGRKLIRCRRRRRRHATGEQPAGERVEALDRHASGPGLAGLQRESERHGRPEGDGASATDAQAGERACVPEQR